MKNRKQLPLIARLDNIKINTSEVIDYCQRSGLFNKSIYKDIQYSGESSHQRFLISNEYCKTNFFTEANVDHMEGEMYKQLYLTDFDENKASNNVKLHSTNIFERTKRLNPKNERYLPEADELNYGIRNSYASGPLASILDQFKSKLTRVRLAWLSPSFMIKPHVDYDPSYIMRYHIPLITDLNIIIGFQKNGLDYRYHLPADGSVYFFNSGIKHWVSNNSKIDRIHLIVDTHGQEDFVDWTELKHITES